MLYDWNNRPIDEKATKPITDRLTHWEPIDRKDADQSRTLNPSKLDQIFLQANTGDAQAQARLSTEMEEKDGDIAAHLSTRTAAVLGKKWRVESTIEDDAIAEKIATEADAMLRAISPRNDSDVDFAGCLSHMLSGILPGYAWSEILWGPGGKTIEGFSPARVEAITFRQSKEPLIYTTTDPMGLPFAPNKFVFHRHRSRSGDATRGGLVRPLGWMFLFTNLGIKDLVRFVEKFGMPFVSARLDEQAWDQDRAKIAYLIRNFGSDGGGVFSKAVEIEMLEGNASNGEVYFKLLDYFGAVKTKVILGQTASSGDSGGLSKGDAQSAVRQDILEGDCQSLSATVKKCILRPWVEFNFGPDAPVPILKIDYEPPADLKAWSEVLAAVSSAGFQVNPEYVAKTSGMPIDGIKEVAPRPGIGLGLSGESATEKKKGQPLNQSKHGSGQVMNRW